MSDFVFLDGRTILLSRADGDFVRSDDGGESWAVVGTLGPPASFHSSSLRRMVPGAEDSVWGLYNYARVDDAADIRAFAVAVSRDRGATFQSVEFDSSTLSPWDLLAVPGADPFVLGTDGQVWAASSVNELSPESFERVGIPNPDESGVGGIACNGEWLVTSSSPFVPNTSRNQRIWRSADSGATWTQELELRPYVYVKDLACSSAGHIWAADSDGLIMLRDPEGPTWETIVDLREVTPSLIGTADFAPDKLAADGNDLFATGWASGHDYLLRVSRDGAVEVLPEVPTPGISSIKVNADGALWAAGWGLFQWSQDTLAWDEVWPGE